MRSTRSANPRYPYGPSERQVRYVMYLMREAGLPTDVLGEKHQILRYPPDPSARGPVQEWVETISLVGKLINDLKSRASRQEFMYWLMGEAGMPTDYIGPEHRDLPTAPESGTVEDWMTSMDWNTSGEVVLALREKARYEYPQNPTRESPPPFFR